MINVNYFDTSLYPRNDIGMAKLFHDAFTDEILYCSDLKEWFSWSGKNWQRDTCLYRCECAKRLAEAILTEVPHSPAIYNDDNVRNFYLRLASKQVRDRIIDDSRSISPVTSNIFNRYKFLFNCQNGTYDFKTHSFRNHNRADFLTNISPVTYTPSATCPRFMQYLDEVMQSKQDKIDYLLKIAAYCITGDTSRECFFVLYGDKTRNGKSTFVSTITELAGDYADTIRPASITRKNISTGGSGATPDIAKLHYSRLVTVSELEDGMMLDISLIKTMTGGNALAARELYASEFKFVPQFKLLIDTNYLPKMTDDSIFNSDRIHVLCFDRHFEPEERDIHLKETLQGEIDGIFNLLIEYYDRLEAEGFVMPQQSQETIRQYALTSNNVKQFTEDMLYRKKDCYEKATDVYKAYQDWCNENNYKVLGAKNFKQKLIDLGLVYTDKSRHRNDRGQSDNTVWVQGITLTIPENPEPPKPVEYDTKQDSLVTFMKEIDDDTLPFPVNDGDLPY